jgi:hypothetical protein
MEALVRAWTKRVPRGRLCQIKILLDAFSNADRDAEFFAREKDLAFQPMIPAGTAVAGR